MESIVYRLSVGNGRTRSVVNPIGARGTFKKELGRCGGTMRLGIALCATAGTLVGMALASTEVLAARVEIYDRVSGEILPVYAHEGRSYVVGEPGHEYEIRIHSANPQRLLAVASVDGVNVITGETAATSQPGYVLDPYGSARIEGWRKSMSRTAAFYFTKLKDSYAARTGRPDNVGVIGVALFREPSPCCAVEQHSMREDNAARAGAAGNAAPAERAASGHSADKQLGTGHGRSEYSAARYTDFERASAIPDETVTIYYDSRRNLIARGVLPSHTRYADRAPQPFPDSFVPDP